MTNNNSRNIIYNYHDTTTANIIIRWAEQYAAAHDVTFDQAMIVTLLEIHNRSGKNDR